MTADTLGGVWTYALELARSLAPHGAEVMLASMGSRLSGEQRAEARSIPNLAVCESSFKLEWMEDPWQDVRAAGEWLLDLERLLKPDVVHLNGYAHGALDWQSPALIVAHSCVLSWWKAVKKAPAPASWERYRYEVARGIQTASMLVAPTRAMLDSVAEHYGAASDMRVIPNGRDCAPFRRSRKERIVFAAGRMWDEAKNLETLERASHLLGWPVYVAGELQHPQGRMARPSGLRTLGHISSPDMAEWLSRASIYALPARYEPFGLSILEAALCECALVLGDIDSLRENWEGAALFVSPDDSQALREALEYLMRDTTRRKALAARARFRALELSSERMAACYISAYADLMAGRALGEETGKERASCA